MLNEDQASCELLFVKKPSGKQRNSTLLDDTAGVRGGGRRCPKKKTPASPPRGPHRPGRASASVNESSFTNPQQQHQLISNTL